MEDETPLSNTWDPEVRPAKLLVADDDTDVLALVGTHLNERGYRVWEAADGDEAMAALSSAEPDLVILDVIMPGRSGWEVCRAIRAAPQLVSTGVIMLTGVGERLNAMTSPLYGADAYLDKPFQLATLDELIVEVLRARAQPSAMAP